MMFKLCVDYKIIAVFKDEAEVYGCVNCGLSMAHSLMFIQKASETYMVSCLECGHIFFCYRRSSSELKCTYGLITKLDPWCGITQICVQKHPRYGLACHGRKDEKPNAEGEYFGSRGIKKTNSGICYKCGLDAKLQLTSSVRCVESGKRVVSMFEKGATLNFRESSPCSVSVNVCACKKHGYNLRLIDAAARLMNGVITGDLVETS